MGDFQGHPFRGNQWTPARGGQTGRSANVSRGDYRTRLGKPKVMDSAEFAKRFSPDQYLWRGVDRREAVDGLHQGEIGGGDFGPGLYFGTDISTAQGYMGSLHQGFAMRAAILPGAKVGKLPGSVVGRDAIERWADRRKLDVIDSREFVIVRNPAVLAVDRRAYTKDETIAIYYDRHGYTQPEGDKHAEILAHMRKN